MKNTKHHSLPVYQNSLILQDLGDALSHYFRLETRTRSYKTLSLKAIIAESLLTDVALLPLTIEEACQSNSLHNKQKNISFINIITRNIISYCNGLEKDGVKEREYIELIRNELQTFRKSFKQWRRSLLNDSAL